MAITLTRKWDKPGVVFTPNNGYADNVQWTVLGSTSDKEAVVAVLSDAAALNNSLTHPDAIDYPTLKAVRVAVTEMKGPQTRIVQADFVDASVAQSFTWDGTHPLISWGWAFREEPVEQDADGNPFQNSAGDPYDPTLTRVVTSLELNVKKRLTAYNALTYMPYANSINSDTFTCAPLGGTVTPRQMKCNIILPENWYEFPLPAGTTIDVVFKFEFRPEGFRFRVPDVGYRAWFKPTSGGTQIKGNILSPNGQHISIPARLVDGYPKDADFKAEGPKPARAFDSWSVPPSPGATKYVPAARYEANGGDALNFIEFKMLTSKVFGGLL